MANSYQIMSLLNGLMMDVSDPTGASVGQSGWEVQTWTQDPSGALNQLWTPEPGPTPGYYYLKSNLGGNWVLDAYYGPPKPAPTPAHFLQLYAPHSGPNQLWKFIPVPPGEFSPRGFIQCLASGPNLIDIPNVTRTRGQVLQIWAQDIPTQANQLWALIPKPGYNYDTHTWSIVQAGQGFRITGTGFQAGTPVLASYSYYIGPASAPSFLESGSFFATVDLGEEFVNYTQLTGLNQDPGTLQIAINISAPQLSQTNMLATWDGRSFTIQTLPQP
jgi:hypothetical protein